MKNRYLSSKLFAILFCVSVSCAFAQHPVRHIVIFKYKKTATPDQIAQVTSAFKALKSKIPGITSIETGVNNSPEKLNKGFTHVYLVSFESLAARDAYLPHPEHSKFKELLGKLAILEEPFVVDFEAGVN